MRGSVFISYRREDEPGYAGRLYDRLRGRFPGRVFMDVGAIEPGADFAATIDGALKECRVLIALIGRRWEAARLQEPGDFVGLEIETALRRGIRVIPVLVRGAVLPGRAELPTALHGLVARQALAIGDANWEAGCAELLRGVGQELGGVRRGQLMVGVGAAVVMVALGGWGAWTVQSAVAGAGSWQAALAEGYRKALERAFGNATDAMNRVADEIGKSGQAPAAGAAFPVGSWRMEGRGERWAVELKNGGVAEWRRVGETAAMVAGGWSYAEPTQRLEVQRGGGTFAVRLRVTARWAGGFTGVTDKGEVFTFGR